VQWLNAECKLKNAKSPSVKFDFCTLQFSFCFWSETGGFSFKVTPVLGDKKEELGIK